MFASRLTRKVYTSTAMRRTMHTWTTEDPVPKVLLATGAGFGVSLGCAAGVYQVVNSKDSDMPFLEAFANIFLPTVFGGMAGLIWPIMLPIAVIAGLAKGMRHIKNTRSRPS